MFQRFDIMQHLLVRKSVPMKVLYYPVFTAEKRCSQGLILCIYCWEKVFPSRSDVMQHLLLRIAVPQSFDIMQHLLLRKGVPMKVWCYAAITGEQRCSQGLILCSIHCWAKSWISSLTERTPESASSNFIVLKQKHVNYFKWVNECKWELSFTRGEKREPQNICRIISTNANVV